MAVRCLIGVRAGVDKGYGSAGANNYSGSRVRFNRRVLNVKSILV